jgi:glycine C-acetyltransferase
MDWNTYFKQQVEELKANGLYWNIRVLEGPSEPRTVVNGKEVIVLCSNNYLGLSTHPRLINAAIEATKKYGAGSGSVRAIAGTMDLHVELEETIAKFKETEAALYYQTGFAVNAGLIPALIGPNDFVLSDELNHGSIIDGVRLSKAEKAIYKHLDVEDLESKLKEAQGKYEKVLIVTDGVFSMDGDVAPLDRLTEVAEAYDAMLYVDDAHGDGVLGKKGKGIVHHFNVQGKVHVEMGTFSKAFGVVGGYICGSKELIEFAFNKSRTWLLSGSAPPAVVAACTEALRLLEENDELVKKLWDNTKYYKKALEGLGFDLGRSETPITPVMLGESKLTQEFSRRLFEEGVFGLPIVYPMVARDKARIRTMVTAKHTKEDIDEAVNAFEKVGRELKVI